MRCRPADSANGGWANRSDRAASSDSSGGCSNSRNRSSSFTMSRGGRMRVEQLSSGRTANALRSLLDVRHFVSVATRSLARSRFTFSNTQPIVFDRERVERRRNHPLRRRRSIRSRIGGRQSSRSSTAVALDVTRKIRRRYGHAVCSRRTSGLTLLGHGRPGRRLPIRCASRMASWMRSNGSAKFDVLASCVEQLNGARHVPTTKPAGSSNSWSPTPTLQIGDPVCRFRTSPRHGSQHERHIGMRSRAGTSVARWSVRINSWRQFGSAQQRAADLFAEQIGLQASGRKGSPEHGWAAPAQSNGTPAAGQKRRSPGIRQNIRARPTERPTNSRKSVPGLGFRASWVLTNQDRYATGRGM